MSPGGTRNQTFWASMRYKELEEGILIPSGFARHKPPPEGITRENVFRPDLRKTGRVLLQGPEAFQSSERSLVFTDDHHVCDFLASSSGAPFPCVGSSRVFFLHFIHKLCGDSCPGLPWTRTLFEALPVLREQYSRGESREWVLKHNHLHLGKGKWFRDTQGILDIVDSGVTPPIEEKKKKLIEIPEGNKESGQHGEEEEEKDWRSLKIFEIGGTEKLILQELINTEQIDGHLYHVRAFALVLHFPCKQSTGGGHSQYKRWTFDELFDEHEYPDGHRHATQIRASMEASIVHAVNAVSGYYNEFFTAGGGKEASARRWGVWTFDFLIQKWGKAYKETTEEEGGGKGGYHEFFDDWWALSHFRIWEGILKIMGMGNGEDPTSARLQKRLSDLGVPPELARYECWMERAQGTNHMPVWPPDGDASSRWFSAWKDGGSFLHAGTGASALREALEASGDSSNRLRWPQGSDRKVLQEKLKERGQQQILREWIRAKEEAGGFEALLTKLERQGGWKSQGEEADDEVKKAGLEEQGTTSSFLKDPSEDGSESEAGDVIMIS
uniref:Uncharacterized protein n=1 Tax=Chromera velia CCMP2878 TaxID=1169474 RepID=A0A0G4HBY4_9ALVE|eukprot:Cvel_6256.t1-p1 / transcript=Cvel_6256.t1 / gene=Cvel_6256 / organism=Chromera_velia_CCMP2878 / gene_product=hypothetical protein / transcript_product=hypothetical protein / location=Cvel_scaffold303:27013-31811(+) / protein_length=554 / sequence_SO=supercontig / SO=protein_coding / is_pseudo=false